MSRAVSLLGLGLGLLAACGSGVPAPAELPIATVDLPPPQAASSLPPAASAVAAPEPALRDGPDGLRLADLAVGTGREAKSGDHVRVHYVGRLADGSEFDASRKRGKPFEFEIGASQVIKGWDLGVVGMRAGGRRKLVIPHTLGYGERGRPPKIPPKATLVFDIELLDVR